MATTISVEHEVSTLRLTPGLQRELEEENARLETASPREIIQWASGRFTSKLTMATAFGPEGCLIISLLAEIAPATHVFNLDTGYQFEETLRLRDRLAERYGMQVELMRPD